MTDVAGNPIEVGKYVASNIIGYNESLYLFKVMGFRGDRVLLTQVYSAAPSLMTRHPKHCAVVNYRG